MKSTNTAPTAAPLTGASSQNPRQLAMFLCRNLLPEKSLTEIGHHFHRDHTTVLYAIEQIAKAIADDLTLIQEIAEIKVLLGLER